jgi:hypothetical protein
MSGPIVQHLTRPKSSGATMKCHLSAVRTELSRKRRLAATDDNAKTWRNRALGV